MKNRLIAAVLIVALMAALCACQGRAYDKAVSLYEDGQYEEALAAFEDLGEYEDASDRVLACKYAIALGEKDAGNYDAAIAQFEELGAYSDAAEQILACKYAAALREKDAGNYDAAIAQFEALGEYSDAAGQIPACRYASAVALHGEGKDKEAIEIFLALGDYEDSAAQIAACLKTSPALLDKYPEYYDTYPEIALQAAEVGDTVLFGSYEQDNDTKNGTERIEWLVLAKEDNRILVISKCILDAFCYSIIYTNPNWEYCMVRPWLNYDFMRDAFNEKQSSMILTTEVTPDKHPDFDIDQGNSTEDKVFLLSCAEAESYFADNDARICASTEYANQRGNSSISAWWLRTGSTTDSVQTACIVLKELGMIYGNRGALTNLQLGIRPAMWVSLEPAVAP